MGDTESPKDWEHCIQLLTEALSKVLTDTFLSREHKKVGAIGKNKKSHSWAFCYGFISLSPKMLFTSQTCKVSHIEGAYLGEILQAPVIRRIQEEMDKFYLL